ncbi:ribonuclease P protein component [uncultured Eudoraea sp.]|jgi:ribonuclease P protein component|uniref:ribonuclease P protein component n=1 Tax=uncultured Eudoraea sp. TaxID=1035614 RepID=UPI0026200BC9|nr:ribonuclease P protein component [uncultured Eudoraea sp.]
MSSKFPKKEKLKSEILIRSIFEEGKSITSYPLKLIYLDIKDPTRVKIQCGVTVPKRNFKSAVKRNRIKRLLRESYRLNKEQIFNNIEGSFAFLFLYIGKEIPGYEEVEKHMRVILEKFLKKVTNENSIE